MCCELTHTKTFAIRGIFSSVEETEEMTYEEFCEEYQPKDSGSLFTQEFRKLLTKAFPMKYGAQLEVCTEVEINRVWCNTHSWSFLSEIEQTKKAGAKTWEEAVWMKLHA